MAIDVLQSEECTLTLDYAWYHVFGCSKLLLLLLVTGNTQFFTAGHNFGLFAMLSDYGYMYLTKQTRTIRVIRDPNSEDFDDLHGIGTFLFFAWFGYLGAFALIVFARYVADAIYCRKLSVTSFLVILQHTIMWWTAPMLSHNLNIDNRVLVLSRSSPKITYIALLSIFTLLLKFKHKVTLKFYSSVILSGIACGLLHHVALFFFNMRGYNSIAMMFFTLLTEWPALMCGEAFFRLQLTGYEKVGQGCMLVLLVAMMIPHLPNDEQFVEFLISYIPGQHMQNFGTSVLWFKTCILPTFMPTNPKNRKLKCSADDDDSSIWIITTPAKSGAVLSAKILLDIAVECNVCLASGTRDRAGIPGPGTRIPTYKGKLLHATNEMNDWPNYVKLHSKTNSFKCVSLTRDPLNRLISFYTYSRSGGEHWVRYETDIMKTLRGAKDLKESIQIFWDRIGKEYLLSSHASYLLDNERGCYEIKFEELVTDFATTIRRLLTVLELSEDAMEPLVEKLMRHDRTNSTMEQEQILTKDMHVSSKKFSRKFLDELERIMMNEFDEISTMIQQMRKDMVLLQPA